MYPNMTSATTGPDPAQQLSDWDKSVIEAKNEEVKKAIEEAKRRMPSEVANQVSFL
jgi:hypothetical protein